MSGPRVTVNEIEAEIASEHYFTAHDGRSGAIAAGTYAAAERPSAGDADLATLKLLTFCVLVLRNGIKVTGESACVSAANFDAGVGRQIARANAISKMWPLLGFRLADRVAQEQG